MYPARIFTILLKCSCCLQNYTSKTPLLRRVVLSSLYYLYELFKPGSYYSGIFIEIFQ